MHEENGIEIINVVLDCHLHVKSLFDFHDHIRNLMQCELFIKLQYMLVCVWIGENMIKHGTS